MATQVFDWIRHHANRAPETIALTYVYSDRSWSYAELSQRIDQLAGSLQPVSYTHLTLPTIYSV